MSTDIINAYVRASRNPRPPSQVRRLICVDGFSLSIQASETHYCEPRINGAHAYTHFEVGYPNAPTAELQPYCSDEGIYAYVPVEVLVSIVTAHGGIAR